MGSIKHATAFYGHPKVIAAGRDARDVYQAGLCWSGEYFTDGYLPAWCLVRLAADAAGGDGATIDAAAVAQRLVAVGLWETAPGGFHIHDYLKHQTSRATMRAVARKRAQAGGLGGRPPGKQNESKTKANGEANREQTVEQTASNAGANGPANEPVESRRLRRTEESEGGVNAPHTPHPGDGVLQERASEITSPPRSSTRAAPKPGDARRDQARADPLFGVLAETVERPVTDDDWQRLRADLQEFTALGATPAEIERRAANYHLLMGADRAGHRPILSRRALLKWWPQCAVAPESAPPASSGRPNKMQIIADGLNFVRRREDWDDGGSPGASDGGPVIDVALKGGEPRASGCPVRALSAGTG